MIQDKIVAHYQDGRLLKGITSNFVPNKDFFHFIPMDSPPGSKLLELRTAELKDYFLLRNSVATRITKKKRNSIPKNRQLGAR